MGVSRGVGPFVGDGVGPFVGDGDGGRVESGKSCISGGGTNLQPVTSGH